MPGGDGASYRQEFVVEGPDGQPEATANLIGYLAGSRAEWSEQSVLVTAHYDHVGYGTRRNSFGPLGYIHNGADDNASGTAALLEVMQAFVNLPEPPRRTVVFAAWDGEEQGLLGSKHWTNYPTIPLDNVRMLINMDMLGRLRNKRLEVFGSRTAPDRHIDFIHAAAPRELLVRPSDRLRDLLRELRTQKETA